MRSVRVLFLTMGCAMVSVPAVLAQDHPGVGITMGYPDLESEVDILFSQNDHHPFDDLESVATTEDVLAMQDEIDDLRAKVNDLTQLLQLIRSAPPGSRVFTADPAGSVHLGGADRPWRAPRAIGSR